MRDQARPPLRPGATAGPTGSTCSRAYGSFHGRTLTTLAATGQPQKQETFQPLPTGFRQVAFADLDALAAAMDERVVRGAARAGAGRGRGAARAARLPRGACAALCDEREALLIIDEVQTGLGRTGKWFGFEHAGGVRPDVVTMAKALGNGVPIGACWARADVADGVQARRPRHDLRRPAARGARRARRARRDGARTTCPRARPRAGERAHRGAARASPGVADVRGVGLLHRGRARRRGIDAGPVAPRVPRRAGSSSTRSRRPRCGSRRRCSSPTTRSTTRVAHPRRGPARRRCAHEAASLPRGRRPHAAPSSRRCSTRARRGRHDPARVPPRARRARASRCCSRSRRPAPARRPRWPSSSLGGHPIYVRPEEVGLGVRESVADVARTLAGYCAVHRGARVRPRARSRAWRRWSTSRSSTCCPTARTRARRSPTSSRCASCSATLEGRRVAYVGDGNNVAASLAFGAALVGRGAHRRVAAGLRARRRRRGAGPQPRRRHRARGRPLRSGAGRRRGLHRRVDVDGPGGRVGVRRAAFAGLHGRRRADGGGAGPRRGSCTACPRTAARRSTAEVIDGPRSRGVAAGRQPHARGACALLAEPAADEAGGADGDAGQAATAAPHRAPARGAGDLEPGAAGRDARGRRRGRDAGDGEPRPRGARRGEGAHPRRRDGVRHPRARQGAQPRPTTTSGA